MVISWTLIASKSAFPEQRTPSHDIHIKGTFSLFVMSLFLDLPPRSDPPPHYIEEFSLKRTPDSKNKKTKMRSRVHGWQIAKTI